MPARERGIASSSTPSALKEIEEQADDLGLLDDGRRVGREAGDQEE